MATAGPALLEFFRQRTPSDEVRSRLAATMRLLGDDSFAVREKATRDMIAAGRNALPLLQAAVNDPDAELAQRARQCLREIDAGPEITLILAAVRVLAERAGRHGRSAAGLSALCRRLRDRGNGPERADHLGSA